MTEVSPVGQFDFRCQDRTSWLFVELQDQDRNRCVLAGGNGYIEERRFFLLSNGGGQVCIAGTGFWPWSPRLP
jgi:hypothetical protein